MMNKINTQKKKRYWLSGGVVGGIISAFLIFIYYLVPALQEDTFIFFFLITGLLIFFGLFHGYLTASLFGADSYIMSFTEELIFIRILPIISVVITYFLIGALVGYIYGKIKERKMK